MALSVVVGCGTKLSRSAQVSNRCLNALWLWNVVRREAIAPIRQIRSYWLCGGRESAVRPRIPARPTCDDGFTWDAREAVTLTVRTASRTRLPARAGGTGPQAVDIGCRLVEHFPLGWPGNLQHNRRVNSILIGSARRGIGGVAGSHRNAEAEIWSFKSLQGDSHAAMLGFPD